MTADLLTLTQWLSPAFPVGGYAYSHGLEQAIAAGRVTDAGGLRDWLTVVLDHGTGRVDATLLCLTLDGADLADTARALAASRERAQEAEDQGRAFVEAVNALRGTAIAAQPLPTAVGQAARLLDLPAPEVAALYLHAFTSNLVSAAVRFVPLGQAEGQKVLSDLHPLILQVAEWAAQATLDDLASGAFGSDLTAMEHETLDVRIFRT